MLEPIHDQYIYIYSKEEEQKYFEPGAAKEVFKLPQLLAGNEVNATS